MVIMWNYRYGINSIEQCITLSIIIISICWYSTEMLILPIIIQTIAHEWYLNSSHAAFSLFDCLENLYGNTYGY